MLNPFSIDDLFTVGVSFDLLGGYLLGRGLLASPAQIARRGSTRWDWNFADMLGQIQAGADGRIGLISLCFGFMLQAGGYVALIAGASVKTGGARAGMAVALAMVAGIAWYIALRIVHLRVVKRLIVDVARADSVSGELAEHPDAGKLLAFGQELGYLLTEVPGPGNPGVLGRYARRHFGVDQVEHHVPSSALGRHLP
jgi:hypothetical protein